MTVSARYIYEVRIMLNLSKITSHSAFYLWRHNQATHSLRAATGQAGVVSINKQFQENVS